MNPFVKSVLSRMLEGCMFEVCVDLGCGEGYFSDVLKAHSRRLIGVDHNLPRLMVAHEFGFYDELVLCDIRDYVFPEGTEAVFMSEVIEHLDKESGWKLLDKLLGMNLKFLMITTPKTFKVGLGFRNHHQSFWTMEEFSSLGFEVFTVPNIPRLPLIHASETIVAVKRLGSRA